MKPILESCSAETLKQLEQEYDDWQAVSAHILAS